MSSTLPMTPWFIRLWPTFEGSGSTNPTITTPSSARRSKSSRASRIAASLVPTISIRSRGLTNFVAQTKTIRQPTVTMMTSRAAITNTPRPENGFCSLKPTFSAGNRT